MTEKFWFITAKTVVINIIGAVILCGTITYAALHEYNELSLLGWIALCILGAIGIYFIRKNYMKPTDKEITEAAINLFVYKTLIEEKQIEKNEECEWLLNESPIGEVINRLYNNAKKNINKGE